MISIPIPQKRSIESTFIGYLGVEAVLDWLNSLGMETYSDRFESKTITGKDLLEIDEKYLSLNMEISDPEHKSLLLKEIGKLRSISRILNEEEVEGAKIVNNNLLNAFYFLEPILDIQAFIQKVGENLNSDEHKVELIEEKYVPNLFGVPLEKFRYFGAFDGEGIFARGNGGNSDSEENEEGSKMNRWWKCKCGLRTPPVENCTLEELGPPFSAAKEAKGLEQGGIDCPMALQIFERFKTNAALITPSLQYLKSKLYI